MDACETQRNNWEELDVTKEELDNLNECLKKEEFRKLFIEYANEVTNEENRKLYQRELIELEKERGVDLKFVNSEPGYVIKTSLNGDKKCFINIGKCDIVEKPTSQPSYEDGNRGLQWSIPYTLSPPHDDLDKKNNRCTVFDVVFHPDTLYLATRNSRFREIVNNTAFDGVENNFKVKLDRKNMKFPKIQFKGVNHSTVIRKKCENPAEKQLDIEPEIYQKLMSSYDEAREKYTNKFTENKKSSRPSPVTKYFDIKSKLINANDKNKSNYTTPKFIVKHQTNLDIQDFQNTKDAKLYAAIPKNLVIVIDLPLLKSSNDAELDVQERLLILSSEKPARYHLELPLPYRVDPNNGNAKFDSSNKKLTITLPVIRDNINKQQFEFKDDSGVESDHGSPPVELNHDIQQQISSSLINNDSNKSPSSSLISKMKAFDEYDDNNDEDEDDNDENKSDNNIKLQTINSSTIYDDAFMSDNIIYSLPNYTSTIYDNILTLTIHIKNVDTGSIKYKLLENNSGIHITLSSVGAGFFPIYYSLCFKIKDDTFDRDTVTVEPWDNNIVFTVGLKNIDGLNHYTVGLNEELMEEKDLPNKISMENKLGYQINNYENNDDVKLNGNKCEDKIEVLKNNDTDVSINVHANNIDSDDEYLDGNYETEKDREINKFVSESSGDELSNSNGSNGSNNITRGILKYRRNNFSRSMSESSIDDTAGLMSSVDLNYDSVQELNSESECNSLKKTVRFNDVVSRQLFRSNSSILGRRKKNQRKLRKKKQAHERRMSESENSETDEREKYKINTTKNINTEKSTDNVKPILNRDKIMSQNNDTSVNGSKTEFKNDLIFDLDI
ncbi:hypothetical protein PV327_007906 [Microctonus hyperodae]|uniref:Protein kintoun n=1 Tax=Microctonus hyperodae TaxID=165561 RepID=A0AA39KZ70_MICHY|nr:hypothetical protein PV327_007906 [Microctonus hyperodae]